jgi:hypothetical protein
MVTALVSAHTAILGFDLLGGAQAAGLLGFGFATLQQVLTLRSANAQLRADRARIVRRLSSSTQ